MPPANEEDPSSRDCLDPAALVRTEAAALSVAHLGHTASAAQTHAHVDAAPIQAGIDAVPNGILHQCQQRGGRAEE